MIIYIICGIVSLALVWTYHKQNFAVNKPEQSLGVPETTELRGMAAREWWDIV